MEARRTRWLQVGLLVLLAVCVGQVVWWMMDEAAYTRRVRDEAYRRLTESSWAADELRQAGVEPERIAELLPELELAPGGREYRPRPEVTEALAAVRWHRLHRFGWEGSFFLAVLVAGMAVLSESLRGMSELQRRQQNFIAAVSHEFKSPLASLRLSLETLGLRDPPAEKRQVLVERMLDDLRRLEMMVFNLLDTSRIEESRIPYQAERLPLGVCVQRAFAELQPTAREAGATLVDAVDGSLEIHADSAAVRAVLHNLLDNAIKATAAVGGGRVEVQAQAESEARGRGVRMTVVDSGCGFDPREAGRLFEKFYRPGDEMRRRSRGSGLGLYLVARLVKLAGGQVQAESPGPGQGARFTVLWPAPPEEAS